jgi:hypothetical protein
MRRRENNRPGSCLYIHFSVILRSLNMNCHKGRRQLFSSDGTRGYIFPLFLLLINSSLTKCASCVSFEISNDWHVLVIFTSVLPLLCMDSHEVTATMGLNVFVLFVHFVLFLRPGGPQIFRKNNRKILGARKSTRSKFPAKDRHI